MEQKQDNLVIWNNVKQVPPNCIKSIKAGRLKGMSDVKPQWRLQAMTHQFGPCGIGWRYVITKKWLEDGSEGQKVAFVDVDLFYKWDGEWSEAVPGNGGSSFIAKETRGLYTSDEAYKMATTDALSVAMKAIGVASDIYMGAFHDGKYGDTSNITNSPDSAGKKEPDKAIPPGPEHKKLEETKGVLSELYKKMVENFGGVPVDEASCKIANDWINAEADKE